MCGTLSDYVLLGGTQLLEPAVWPDCLEIMG